MIWESQRPVCVQVKDRKIAQHWWLRNLVVSEEFVDGGLWKPVSEHAVDAITPLAAAALHDLLDSPGEPPLSR